MNKGRPDPAGTIGFFLFLNLLGRLTGCSLLTSIQSQEDLEFARVGAPCVGFEPVPEQPETLGTDAGLRL